MKIDDPQQFVEYAKERGYSEYPSNRAHKPEHTLYKSFERVSDDCDGYQICLEVWDHRRLDKDLPCGVSFEMLLNHNTPIDISRMDIGMMCDGMDVPEFERRCVVLWRLLREAFPAQNKPE